MPTIEYDGVVYQRRAGEGVLDALLRQGINAKFSCRNGICQACLLRCTTGEMPDRARRGLPSRLHDLGYFLPCVAVPEGDVVTERSRSADLFSRAMVVERELLGPAVCRLLLEPASSLYYHAGQFINVRHSGGDVRSYSLASLPMEDHFLELHVKKVPGGLVSGWLVDDAAVGDEIEFQGPHGSCFYTDGSLEQNMLLVATGTGLAPLAGVIRDALHSGHRGRIALYHGSRQAEGLYLDGALRETASRHPNFDYSPCVSGDDVPGGMLRGRAHRRALAATRDLRGWRIYLAGHPGMIEEAETLVLRAGADPRLLHTDPHETSARTRTDSETVQEADVPAFTGTSTRSADPAIGDDEMWRALGEGDLLREILTDFYTRVFDDPVLAPYFRGVTRDRLIGQVFSFMRDQLTGENLYFGSQPRGAHHWMVISDEIFDYRERLMQSCLRRHGLSDPLIRRWRQIEEGFRRDIVKAEPVPLVVNGVEFPLDGFGEETVAVGVICDACEQEVAVGESVRYHLRLGHIYCRDCSGSALEG